MTALGTPLLIFAGVSIATFMIGGMCLLLASWLPTFEPCRTLYRVHNAVQDTFQCQAFSVLWLIGIALLSMGSIAAVIAASVAIRQRWRATHS